MKWFVGVDVSKESLHVAIRGTEDEWLIEALEVSNDEEGFEELKGVIEARDGDGCLGLEASGGYEEPLMIWMNENTQCPVTRLNPYRIKAFAKSRLSRAKTDVQDAKAIATFMEIHRPEPSETPDTAKHEMRGHSRHLEHLKKKRAQEKTYLESINDPVLEEQIEETIRHYDEQIERIKDQLEEDEEKHDFIRETIDYVVTITSIGRDTARALILEMQDGLRPDQIEPKQEVAHSGIAPEIKQSGQWKGKAKMSKTGNARIRKLLYFPTLNALNHNPIIERYYDKLISKGKEKMVAVVACMRKLLHIVVGVIKNQAEFDPDWEAKKA